MGSDDGTTEKTTTQLKTQVNRNVVTPKKRPAREADGVVVTPSPRAKQQRTLPSSTLRPADAEETSSQKRWAVAMSLFGKFQPGLGHDGVGLYGTLTPPSARKVLERLEVANQTHVDVGAADGKMMLGALAFGAQRSYGIEVAGDCLEAKFNAMKGKLSAAFGEDLEATLKCETDICSLRGSVPDWLESLFNVASTENDIVLTAVWHGFTIAAKTALLRGIAEANGAVKRFSLVGPIRKDFGDPDDVLNYLAHECGLGPHRVVLAHHDRVTLAGGEAHRALTFHVLP